MNEKEYYNIVRQLRDHFRLKLTYFAKDYLHPPKEWITIPNPDRLLGYQEQLDAWQKVLDNQPQDITALNGLFMEENEDE